MLAESSGLIAGGAALWVAASVVYPRKTPAEVTQRSEPVAATTRANPLSPRFVSAIAAQPVEQNHYFSHANPEPDVETEREPTTSGDRVEPITDAVDAGASAPVPELPDVDEHQATPESIVDAAESFTEEPLLSLDSQAQIELGVHREAADMPEAAQAAVSDVPPDLPRRQEPAAEVPADSHADYEDLTGADTTADDLHHLSQQSLVQLNDEHEVSDTDTSGSNAFAEDRENMQWLRPLDLPGTKNATVEANESAASTNQFTWLRSVAAVASFEQSDLDVLDRSLDERIGLAHTAILTNEPEYLAAIAQAYDEDGDLRPTIYALLERYNPSGARTIYKAMLSGSREDMCLAIDRLIEHGYVDDLAPTFKRAPHDVIEYIEFCMRDAGIDVADFVARHAEAS